MHDPRAAAGFAIQYATGSIGATHSEAQFSSYFIEDYLYVNPEDEQRLRDVLEEFGYSARLDRFETQGKGELVAKMQNFGAMLNSLVVCSFMLEYQRVRPSEFLPAYRALHRAISQELVASVHGVYKGGLGVHLALVAMGGSLHQKVIEVPGYHNHLDDPDDPMALVEAAEDLQQVMGHRFVRAYCAVKREEFEAFNKVISSWEREYLLLNV